MRGRWCTLSVFDGERVVDGGQAGPVGFGEELAVGIADCGGAAADGTKRRVSPPDPAVPPPLSAGGQEKRQGYCGAEAEEAPSGAVGCWWVIDSPLSYLLGVLRRPRGPPRHRRGMPRSCWRLPGSRVCALSSSDEPGHR